MLISDWSSDVCSSDLSQGISFQLGKVRVRKLHGRPQSGRSGSDRVRGDTVGRDTSHRKGEDVSDSRIARCAVLGIFTVGLCSVPGALLALIHETATTKIGRAHVCTPVTNAHIIYPLLLETKKRNYYI